MKPLAEAYAASGWAALHKSGKDRFFNQRAAFVALFQPWIDWRVLHDLSLSLVLISAMFLHVTGSSVDLLAAPFVAAIILLTLGVPHGAFDIAILQARYGLTDVCEFGLALAAYLALAGLVLVMWWWQPGISLTAFLLVATYHFGGDLVISGVNDSAKFIKNFGLQRIILGTSMLTATTWNYQTQVTEIFVWLSSPEAAKNISTAMHLLAVPCAIVAMITLVDSFRHSVPAALNRLMILIAAFFLPPITFFVIYFCFYHSVRHVVEVRTELAMLSISEVVLSGLPYALAAIVGCCAGAAIFISLGAGRALLSVVFIALAALTLPHMVLIDANQRHLGRFLQWGGRRR
jgi:beta-carotene 15,15'-dioxygenase